MQKSTFLTFLLGIILMLTSKSVLAVTPDHLPHSRSHVDHSYSGHSLLESTALPGSQCYSTHNKLEEKTPPVFDHVSFCSYVVDNMSDAYPNEEAARSACTSTFGEDKCFHQCRYLAQLFDQTKASSAYGIKRGNFDEYTINQRDCENCLQYHQCTPRNIYN
jgi:hypothetical protein